MDETEHIAAVAERGGVLLAAAEEAGLEADVPTCPGWAVADLVAHTAGVHRWATSFLLTGRPGPATDKEEAEYFRRPPDGELLAWARAALAGLVSALSQAPATLDCWSFLPAPSPLAFWARRQAHETAVHSVDARSAAGLRSRFSPVFAADGVDELLVGFYGRPRSRLRSERPVVLGVQLSDDPAGWAVEVGAEGARPSRGFRGGDCTVRGPASDVYQLLWNRLSPAEAAVEVGGEAGVLDLWRSQATVRWA